MEHSLLIIDAVYNSLKLDLDLTGDTLSILDHYISSVGKVDNNILFLLSSTSGAYFGELLRRSLGGKWHIPDIADPINWELRFTGCPLAVFPIALAAEIISKSEIEGVDLNIRVAPSRFNLLHELLEKSSQLYEDDYYSFSGKLDIIELSVDFLSNVEEELIRKSKKKRTNFSLSDPSKVKCIPLSIME
jgi:hypothetical protein